MSDTTITVGDALFASVLECLSAERGRMGRASVRVRLGDGRQWFVDLRAGTFRPGQAGDEALAELRLNEIDLLSLVKGKIRPEDLYQRGRLWVDGDMALARRLAGALYRLSAGGSRGG